MAHSEAADANLSTRLRDNGTHGDSVVTRPVRTVVSEDAAVRVASMGGEVHRGGRRRHERMMEGHVQI